MRWHQRYGLLACLALLVTAGAVGLWYAMLPMNDGGQPTQGPQPTQVAEASEPPGEQQPEEDGHWVELRRQMVERQLRSRDITDQRVLQVMQHVPRHLFVSPQLREQAYADQALPIEHGQTISQPYIVALMTQLARPKPDSRALDVGTGSGYQAAVLAELCKEVYSIEIIPALAEQAKERLKRLGYKNVHVRSGDGYRGWPEHAPFDLIIVAAAPDHIPQPLVDQLAPGARLVIPVGSYFQDLIVVEKQQDGTTRQWKVAPVAFVPMTGEAQRHAAPP